MILFFAQGSDSLGMGHVSRTLILYRECRKADIPCALVLALDAYADSVMGASQMEYCAPNKALMDTADMVVIDAVEISDELASLLASVRCRILISPVFNKFELATHIFVRELARDVKKALPPRVKVIEDINFAFITAELRPDRVLDYRGLHVGICLSGGRQDFPLSRLLFYLKAIENLVSVTVVGDSMDYGGDTRVTFIPVEETSKQLWKRLKHINVFIGRQGLMVSEAVAQTLPVVSFLEEDEAPKNEVLNSLGLVRHFEISDSGFTKACDHLKQKEGLESCHNKIKEFLQTKIKSKESLFVAISDLIH